MKKYLFFVSLSYSYSILRPLQDEIWRRGDEVAWYIEKSTEVRLRENEKHLKTIKEIMEYNPVAVFAPGVRLYDFIPGVKVGVFHGLYYKRSDFGDHYKIRGFFDMYCTTSPMFTPKFKELEQKHGFFKVYETGWCKFDGCVVEDSERRKKSHSPVILYSPTFSKGLTSLYDLYDKIEELIKKRDWEWKISLHPKTEAEIANLYKGLAEKYENVSFCDTEDKIPLLKSADVMLSDSSSVIYEFLWFDKPAVTYKNTFPADHLINIESADELEAALDRALMYPDDLLQNIRHFMDQVHPFRDGKSSARILDATDDFIANYKGRLRRKPLNLFRRLKMRKKAKYFPFGPRYKTS